MLQNRQLIYFLRHYLSLLGLKFYIFLGISLVSTLFQGLAAAAFLTVLRFGSVGHGQDRVSRMVYSVIDFLNISGRENILLFLLVTACVSFFISSMALLLSRVYTAKVETHLFAELQMNLVEKLFKSKYEYYISKSIGAISDALIQQVRSTVSSFKFLGNIITSTMFALLYLSLSVFVDTKLVFFSVIIAAPIVFFFKFINVKNKYYSAMMSDSFGRLSNILMQFLPNYKYLKATNTFKDAMKIVAKEVGLLGYYIRRLSVWGNMGSDAVTPFAVTCISALIYFNVAVMNVPILDAIATLGLLYASYQKGITIPVAYQKFLSLSGSILIYLDLKEELEREEEKMSGPGKLSPDFSGSIVFENMSFRYRDAVSDTVEDLNLEIKPRSTVAFVGGSGAGKSTVINMITGLLNPTKGRILLSGRDYRDLDMEELRKSIGYVTQESVVFHDTVKNNIALWNPDTKEEEIEKAAKTSHADSFIKEFPHKYDTVLGNEGINISGGQRQRLTIAREILRNTPVLILDEATSSLDSETEKMIQQSIDDFSGEKTVIIVAHRLSTIKNSDMIFVLDKGRVVEEGSYGELYSAHGRFYEMVRKQALEKTE